MKKIVITYIVPILLLLTGCLEDPGVDSPENYFFTLHLTVDGIGTGALAETRATVPSVGDEDKLNSLYLLFFEYKTDGSGTYAGIMEYTNEPQMNMTIPMSAAGLSYELDYTIMALANIENFTGILGLSDYLNQFFTMTESQALESAVLRVSGVGTDQDDDTQAISAPLPMSGITMKKAKVDNITMNLTRNLSRFDVQNTRSVQYDMVSVSIWNAREETNVWNINNSPEHDNFTERFYGLKREAPVSGELEDILGGLYSFENFYSSPEIDDEVTTCLIVGLQPRSGAALGTVGKTMFYRVNVHPENSSQNLKRNYVYKVSIRNVNNEGAESEYEAWKSTKTGLEVSINNWNLDDEGMIITDGNNTMVVPVKRVRLDPLGDVREYSIFTMGDGNLIISKTQLPSGIKVLLKGNLLTVTATPLEQTETERRGSIELSFAGLRGTIDFIQSSSESEYLTLSKSSLPAFPALGFNVNSGGPVEVTSSGPWVAKIYNMTSGSNPGFSFAGGGGMVTEITQQNNGSDSFFIYSTGDNPINESRHSFMVVSLVDNEEINRAVVLTQKPITLLKLDPQIDEVTFNPLGAPRGIDGAVPGNAFTFSVDPGSEDGVANEWDAEITGLHAQYFQLTKTSLGFDRKIEITAKGTENGTPHQNLLGINLSARIRVWLTDASPGTTGTEVFIGVNQDPVGLDYYNNGIATVPVTGVVWNDSRTAIIDDFLEYTIDINAGLRWKATIIRQGVDSHPAFLIDASGQRVAVLDNMTSADPLRVGFDKIHYPLVERTPEAEVRVEIVGAGDLNTVITVSQEALVPRPMRILDVLTNDTPYGSLIAESYNRFYVHYLRQAALFGENGRVKTKGPVTISGYTYGQFPYSAINPIPYIGTNGKGNYTNGIAYVHMGGREPVYSSAHLDAVENWRKNTDAVLVWPHDTRTTANSFDNSKTILNRAGYQIQLPSATAYNANRLAGDLSVKILAYLLKDGPFTGGTPINYNGITFYNDGICTGVNPGSLPADAVVVMSNTGNNAAILVIDPRNRLVYFGESQLFHGDGNIPAAGSVYTESSYPSSDKDKFLCNLLAYIINAGQYGSHFTDLFIDDELIYPFPENLY